jgi:hypothetical protein
MEVEVRGGVCELKAMNRFTEKLSECGRLIDNLESNCVHDWSVAYMIAVNDYNSILNSISEARIKPDVRACESFIWLIDRIFFQICRNLTSRDVSPISKKRTFKELQETIQVLAFSVMLNEDELLGVIDFNKITTDTKGKSRIEIKALRKATYRQISLNSADDNLLLLKSVNTKFKERVYGKLLDGGALNNRNFFHVMGPDLVKSLLHL